MKMAELAEIVIGVGYKVEALELRFDGLETKIDEKIDGFAMVVAKSFARVDERLDGVDGRLDSIDERLDGVDIRLDSIDGTLVLLEMKIDDTRSDVKSLIFEGGKSKERIENLEIHSFGSIQAA